MLQFPISFDMEKYLALSTPIIYSNRNNLLTL